MPATETVQGTATDTETARTPSHSKLQYATKTSLSLTLAYLIPMAMGWPQPSTAATTVMLITATGLASESLKKGVTRVMGTVVGAAIGLSLIALFPQERMTYLLAVSITVSCLAYLYNAYQGDSTLFMLAAVVTLMVFNGGDAEGAFLYGVDRAFMTVFGVIVYTVVANTLWPVRAVDNTHRLAAGVTSGYRRAFALLVHPVHEGPENNDEQLASLLTSEETFQTHFASIKGNSDGIDAYLAEWQSVVACYEELQAALLPALRQQTRRGVEFNLYIDNYDQVVEHVERMFSQVDERWRGEKSARLIEPVEVSYRKDSLREVPHLTVAAVATRAELLDKLQQILLELDAALDSMLYDKGGFKASRKPRGKPAFIWLDLENAKTAVRMFCTFWMATAVWIAFNPPMGFSFVALSSILVLLVSYTPVTPKLLFILFSFGFIFALPAYVFLLPQMSHWLQLAAFMFAYAFIGFYLLQGPVSIFFLLGLFTLSIQNTMSYNFDIILLVILTFYLMCAMLIITIYFPFTSKPEKLYGGMLKRFFRKTARTLERASDYRPRPRALPAHDGSALLAKLHTWGNKIDGDYFSDSVKEQIAMLNQACDLLLGQVTVLLLRREEFSRNSLISAAGKLGSRDLLVDLTDDLASGNTQSNETHTQLIESKLLEVRDRLDELRQPEQIAKYDRTELAQFFVYLNLRASILDTIRTCQDAQRNVDWNRLAGQRF